MTSPRPGNQFIQKCLGVVGRLAAGSLTLVLPDGSRYVLAGTGSQRPAAEIHIKRWRAIRKFLTQGDFGFVESYLDADWESPNLVAVIELAVRNTATWNSQARQGVLHHAWHRFGHMLRGNSRRGSRRNIAAHYDLGNEFYGHWLDPSMTYSSAYFEKPEQTLGEGQAEKYRRIAHMLDLKPHHRLLEIGFGWGGFAEFAAREYGCRVTGVTLSREQLNFARTRMQKAGIAENVDLRLQDYRDVDGTFDRIASIEMFEAVGEAHWPRYFDTLRERLTKGGAAALQIITISEERFERYRSSADFIQRYIFPGGMLPSVERFKSQVELAKLRVVEATMFGDSYARTLRQWRDAFLGAWANIESLGFDERFRRMWEMYLAYCEGGFRGSAIDVGQFKLVRP